MPDQPKPFEPPPWEQEAFERFRKAQDEARTQAELEMALQQVRSPETGGDRPAETEALTEAPLVVDQPAESREPGLQEAGRPASLSEARIDAMLIELRSEEPSAPVANKGLIYGTIAFMTVTGTYIIIQSALLFGNVRTDAGAGTLFAGMMSFVVLLIGLGFFGGAFLLFRKYRQHL
ncbi:MAG: hypothetical protein JXA36_08055 [Coriobacteriia bacterium]|nr:hypothetical protein [Coriobacteriia bacterium]